MKDSPSDRATAGPKLGIALLFVALVAVLGGCNLITGAPTPTPFSLPTRIPATPTPTATPIPTETPLPEDMTPTPTPVPTSKLTSGAVRQRVFTALSQCANQISQATEGSVVLVVTTDFLSEIGLWQSQVTSSDQSLYFGTWHTSDETGEITPVDVVADTISAPNTVCSEPVARLSEGPVPVLALPAIAAKMIASAEIAELRVWTQVFNCYDSFPELSSFTAYPNDETSWIVEGRAESGGLSTETHYGLWKVTALTGDITPLDLLATQAAATCDLPQGATFPPVITSEQAALRVWAAVYDCFTPRPKNSAFNVLVDNPQRWLVEGRGEETIEVQVEQVTGGTSETFTEERVTTVFYGLYVVDATTGRITPWDTLASGTAAQFCYRPT